MMVGQHSLIISCSQDLLDGFNKSSTNTAVKEEHVRLRNIYCKHTHIHTCLDACELTRPTTAGVVPQQGSNVWSRHFCFDIF